jgi:hypothetical protein
MLDNENQNYSTNHEWNCLHDCGSLDKPCSSQMSKSTQISTHIFYQSFCLAPVVFFLYLTIEDLGYLSTRGSIFLRKCLPFIEQMRTDAYIRDILCLMQKMWLTRIKLPLFKYLWLIPTLHFGEWPCFKHLTGQRQSNAAMTKCK